MPLTTPSASTSHTNSAAATAAIIAAAQAAFVAHATVLILDATALGQTFIQPFMVPNVTSDYITSYFQPLGYTVVFPLVTSDPFNPAFIPGFPEVLPSDFGIYGNTSNGIGPPRCSISWA